MQKRLFFKTDYVCKIPGVCVCVCVGGGTGSFLAGSLNDPRDPLSYRGITITPSIYKLYCNVLNNRLMKWETENSIIHDAQNGFRKDRSTIDQIRSLTSIIDSRKLKRQSTFTAFIDFSTAYDSTDRNILFQKLQNLGLNGNIFNAIMSLYDHVKCCVRINGMNNGFFVCVCRMHPVNSFIRFLCEWSGDQNK